MGDTWRVDEDPRRQLRIGHAERESSLERLRDAHAEGRLDTAEFYARLDAVYDAKTYADLDALVADLPTSGLVRYPSAPPSQQRPTTAMSTAPTAPTAPTAWSRPAPATPPARPPTPRTAAGALAAMPAALRGVWVTWATAVAINVVVWALVSILTSDWIYPWPLWVAGPWGVVNLGMTATWWLNRKPPEAPQLPPAP